jgi:hypothetical protein
MTFPELTISFISEPVGHQGMCVVPTVVITGLDVLGDGDDFAEQRAAVVRGSEQGGSSQTRIQDRP